MRPLLLLLLGLAVLPLGCTASPTTQSPAVVAAPTSDPKLSVGTFALSTEREPVVDGDTIRVDGLDRTLRLLGIDTEETFRDPGKRQLCDGDWREYLAVVYAGSTPDRPPKFATPMGEAAKEFAREFFDGLKTVHLQYDDPRRTVGYFGRHLVHVLAKKQDKWVNYNVEIVRMGYSPYFKKYGRCRRYHDAFMAAEKQARTARRGIWAESPRHACYPDYEKRLVWWAERDRDIAKITALRAKDDNLFVLGEDAEWERLKKQAGKRVTVASSVGGWRKAGGRGIVYLGHRNRKDFAVIGPLAKMTDHPIRETSGDLLLVTGVVTLWKGDPQFQVDTVTWKRVTGK